MNEFDFQKPKKATFLTGLSVAAAEEATAAAEDCPVVSVE